MDKDICVRSFWISMLSNSCICFVFCLFVCFCFCILMGDFVVSLLSHDQILLFANAAKQFMIKHCPWKSFSKQYQICRYRSLPLQRSAIHRRFRKVSITPFNRINETKLNALLPSRKKNSITMLLNSMIIADYVAIKSTIEIKPKKCLKRFWKTDTRFGEVRNVLAWVTLKKQWSVDNKPIWPVLWNTLPGSSDLTTSTRLTRSTFSNLVVVV